MRKILIFFLFFALVGVNLAFAVKLTSKNRKIAYTQQILDEIAAPVKAETQFNLSSAPLVMGSSYEAKVNVADGRSANLKSFFRKHNSPLYDKADFVVAMADKYGLDYRLLPAIAMQESNLCRVIPNNSYNCWGWGIYGSTVTRFESYEDAIETVSKGLKKHYIDKGLITATAIMQKYNPSSPNGSWAHGVNTFLQALE